MKEIAKDEKTEECKLDVRKIVKITKKGTEAKTKKDKNVRNKLNKEFQRVVRRYKKQHYNICKGIVVTEKQEKSFKRYLNSEGSSNLT